jgi:hypothetical protein
MHTLAVQKQQRQRLVQQRAALTVRRFEADDLVRADEPRVHRGTPLLADVDEERRGGGGAVVVALGVGVGEQLDDGPLLGHRQELRVEFEPEERREELALAGDLHLPGGTGQIARLRADEVPDAQPARVGGQFGERDGVLGGRLGGEQHEVRGPTGVLGRARTAGQDRVVPRGTQRTAPLPRLRLHGLHERLDVVEVAEPVGRERSEVLAEADEGDRHAVGPAVGGQLGGHGGEHARPVLLTAAQRDDAGHGLQIEEEP